MSDTLHIDHERLAEHISYLQERIGDEGLRSSLSEIDATLSQSIGSCARTLQQLNSTLGLMTDQFYLLMSRTCDFLNNANMVTATLDEGISQGIGSASEQ